MTFHHSYQFRTLFLSALFALLVVLPVSQSAYAQSDFVVSPLDILPPPTREFNLFGFGSSSRKSKKRDTAPVQAVVQAPVINTKNLLQDQGLRPEGDFTHFAVVGDGFAADLAAGLADLTASDSQIWVENVPVASAVLAGAEADFVLAADLSSYLALENPQIIFVMLGLNDRQAISNQTDSYNEINSLDWRAAYIARIDAVLQVLLRERVPVVWVGLPPVEDVEASKDLSQFNQLYRQRVEAAGFFYLDIWDSFADETGAFMVQGPNIDGDITRLRNEDGIGLRNQGKRKLAFFADRLRKRILGTDREMLSTLQPLDAGKELRRRVVLTGLSAQGGSILSGGQNDFAPSAFEPLGRETGTIASEILARKPGF